MKGGTLVILAILGLAIPLFAAKEGPENLEIPEDKMNEDLDSDDSDEDSDEDYDELDLDRRRSMERWRFMSAARREWRQKMMKMQESKNMSRGQMKMAKRKFMMSKRYEWYMMKANQMKKMANQIKKMMKA